MDKYDIFLIVASTIGFAFTLYGLIDLNRKRSKNFYDAERSRVELEWMRKYLETLVYEKVDRLSADAGRWRDINHLVVDASSDQKVRSQDGKRSFLRSLGLDDDVSVRPGTAFILTPFHPRFESTYKSIANACRVVGLEAMRGDEEHISSSILPFVVEKMLSASVVIANIDGRNPNVFYELGIAHALDKDVIIVSSSIKDVPFDLQSQRIVLWKTEEDLIDGLNKAMMRLYIHRERS